MSQKVKYRFEFEVSDSWTEGESACWTECPFSPLIGLGHTCKFLTTEDLKCPFRDKKFNTLRLIEIEGTLLIDGRIIFPKREEAEKALKERDGA